MAFFSKKQYRFSAGQAALTTVIMVLFISLTVMVGFASLVLTQSRLMRNAAYANKSFFAAEAGIEDVVYRLKTGKQASSQETIVLDNITATTDVADIISGKEIIATGEIANNIRRIKASLSTGIGTEFVYGVQVGEGGLIMDNAGKITGSVYANGPIEGTNSPIITGDAFVASNSTINNITVQGNARAYAISNSTVQGSASTTTSFQQSTTGKHVYADTISNATIGRNAYYQTSITSSTVGGATYPGTPVPSILPPLSMPIPDSQLNAWEQEAEAGGIISSPCPYQPPNGALLGPIKIACDLVIDGTKIITLAGTLWVAGNMTIANSAQIRLDPSFGSDSGIIVIDNPADRFNSSIVTIQNSAQILGTGVASSYVLVASRNSAAENGFSTTAIDISNSSAGPIYYAPHGKITVQNNTNLKEALAYKLHIKNSAQVTYETGPF